MRNANANAFRLKNVMRDQRPSKTEGSRPVHSRADKARVAVAALPRKRMLVASKADSTAAARDRDRAVAALPHSVAATSADPVKTGKLTKKKFNGKYRKHRPNFPAVVAGAANVW